MKKLLGKLCVLLMLAGITSTVFSQRALVDTSARVNGIIDSINEEEKLIVINGNRLELREAELTVNYNGEEIDSIVLEEGQRVSYRTRQDGSISEINLLSRLRLEQQPGNN